MSGSFIFFSLIIAVDFFPTSFLDLLKLVVLLWFCQNVLPIHLSFLYFALFIYQHKVAGINVNIAHQLLVNTLQQASITET